MIVMCCQVELSATGRFLVQRNLIDCVELCKLLHSTAFRFIHQTRRRAFPKLCTAEHCGSDDIQIYLHAVRSILERVLYQSDASSSEGV